MRVLTRPGLKAASGSVTFQVIGPVSVRVSPATASVPSGRDGAVRRVLRGLDEPGDHVAGERGRRRGDRNRCDYKQRTVHGPCSDARDRKHGHHHGGVAGRYDQKRHSGRDLDVFLAGRRDGGDAVGKWSDGTAASAGEH